MNYFSIESTIALVLMFAAALVVFANPVKAYVHALLGFVVASSVSVLLSLVFGPDFIKPSLVALSLATIVVCWLLVKPRQPFFTARNLLSVAAFSGITIGSQLVARTFGLSSVAFTDGHVIILMGKAFQTGELDPMTGLRALKRGFGLPAMQSLGLDGEYFVGLMPLFFLGAILATLWLVSILTNSTRQAALVAIPLLALVLSTEAITRHAFLINTHSIAWMVTAMLLVYLRKQIAGDLDYRAVRGVILSFTAIGLLRLDYLILFAAFTLFFVISNAVPRPKLAIGVVLAQGLASVVWIVSTVKDFPFLGSVGPFVLFVVGMAGTALFVWFLRARKSDPGTYSSTVLFLLALGMWVITFVLSDIASAVRALTINLFAGEGLWGFSVGAALIVWISSFTRPRLLDKSVIRNVASVGALMVSLYLFSKYLDQIGSGTIYPDIVRIGFGDSLNRTLVTWLPFLVFPLVRLIGSKPNTNSGSRALGQKERKKKT